MLVFFMVIGLIMLAIYILKIVDEDLELDGRAPIPKEESNDGDTTIEKD